MAVAALKGVFYLDDPQDGASTHLLGEIGVTLHRKGGAAEAAASGVAALSAAGLAPAPAPPAAVSLAAEHSFPTPCGYSVAGGSCLVDVRDSVDAWVRIVLHDGDAVALAAGVHHRVPARGTPVVVMPVFPADADRHSRMTTVVFPRPADEIATWGAPAVHLPAGGAGDVSGSMALRFAPGSPEEAASNEPHFQRPGTPHTRDVVVDLCDSFYHLGWVTGTGGSISIRHGNRIFMAPSGVQKERMQRQDMYCLDTSGAAVYAPAPLPGKPRLKLSQCAPLFQHAFSLRKAGACIHTHDISAVMTTLQNGTEFSVTHQEMIKGVAGHGFLDTCTVPIIENTPHECDLADSLEEAMRRYPRSNAVLVRRHGVYVWGDSWESAKTQAECYHYLFDAAVRMRGIGIDPAATPARVDGGIGAETSYGTALAGTGGKRKREGEHAHEHGGGAGDACCGGAGASSSSSAASGFGGAAGVAAQAASSAAAALPSGPAPASACADPRDVDAVVLDIEGTTTSIAFVTDTLFPYAAAHLRQWLLTNWAAAEAAGDVTALGALSEADVAAGTPGAAAVAVTPAHVAAFASAAPSPADKAAALAAIEANVAWQMGANRKSGALKQLQGHIWRSGYEGGSLRGHVYADTPAALAAWTAGAKPKRAYIYSSGSREAQRLLFAHSQAGDLRGHLAGYFDTAVGPKVAPASYADIVLSLGVDGPGRVLFVTDSIAEARAAAAAGLVVAITDRPGNAPLPEGHGFRVVTSLLELV